MEKLEISLTPDLMRRIDDVVELLDLHSREDLVLSAVRRFVDRCHLLEIRAR
jgi:metal-responsive CopG/Arc/MetJ family transcriptional regulator